jgi:hypothetical protein
MKKGLKDCDIVMMLRKEWLVLSCLLIENTMNIMD